MFANIGGDNTYRVAFGLNRSLAAYIGTAALYALHQSFSLQNSNSLSNRLSAVARLGSQLVFTGQFLPTGIQSGHDIITQPTTYFQIHVFSHTVSSC